MKHYVHRFFWIFLICIHAISYNIHLYSYNRGIIATVSDEHRYANKWASKNKLSDYVTINTNTYGISGFNNSFAPGHFIEPPMGWHMLKFDHLNTIHIPNPLNVIENMSHHELAERIATEKWTADTFFNHKELFINKNYREIAKTYPGYSTYVEKHYQELINYNFFQRIWYRITGDYNSEILNTFTEMHKDCEAERAAQILFAQKEQAYKENERKYQTVITQLKRSQESVAHPKKYTKARIAALEKTQRNSNAIPYVFTLTKEQCEFIVTFEMSRQEIERLTLNPYQHHLHTEFLEYISPACNLAKGILKKNEYQALKEIISSGIECGMELNRKGNIAHATEWSDWTRTALKALGRGGLNGLKNATRIIIHPIETIKSIADVGHSFILLSGKSMQLQALADAGYDEILEKEFERMADTALLIDAHCREELSNLTWEKGLEHTTAFVVDFITTPIIFKTISKGCKALAPLAKLPFRLKKTKGLPDLHLLTEKTPLLTIRALEVEHEIEPTVIATQKTLQLIKEVEKDAHAVTLLPACQPDNPETISHAIEIYNEIKQTEKIASHGAKTGRYVGKKIECLIKPWINKEALINRFEGTAYYNGKSVLLEHEHLHSIHTVCKIKRSGHLTKPNLYGWHHDPLYTLRNSGAVIYENIVEGVAGAFQAEPIVNGVKYGKKTFFPPHWTHEKVAESIFEVFNDLKPSIINLKPDVNGSYVLVGLTKEGLKIQMIFNPIKNIIETAFPLIKKFVYLSHNI